MALFGLHSVHSTGVHKSKGPIKPSTTTSFTEISQLYLSCPKVIKISDSRC